MKNIMLKKLLEKNRISAYRLSKETGISESAISKIINGKTGIRDVSAGTLYSISSYFNVPMDSFLNTDAYAEPETKTKRISRIPDTFRSVFWDTDFESLDPNRNSIYIISRMFCKGGLKGIRWIEQNYGKEEIVQAARMSRDLNPIIANHLKNKYQLKKEDMNYYKIENSWR